MGIEVEGTCTPRVERKVVAAMTVNSREQASEQLRDLGDVSVCDKRCERIAQRVGKERVAQREDRLAKFEALPLPQQRQAPPSAPLGDWGHRVAVVMVDGGRAQLRDEQWGQPRTPGQKKPQWWRESKVSLLSTFCSQPQEADPLPSVPKNLLDPLWLIPKINEIKAAKGGESAALGAGDSSSHKDDGACEELSAWSETSSKSKHRRWSPEPLVRSVVATFEPYAKLGRLARTEAHHRGFDAASRKAYVSDGLPSNWTIHQTHFSGYTPIVDLLHALGYVYQAAQAVAADMEEAWTLCRQWVTWTWQGKVSQVIDALDQRQTQTTDPATTQVLEQSRRYLHNNRQRMRYDEYRKQGLPITTALMESTIKRINRRMKGTEKFWREGAEPLLQLCADKLSETRPMDTFWRQRAESQTGQRKSRASV